MRYRLPLADSVALPPFRRAARADERAAQEGERESAGEVSGVHERSDGEPERLLQVGEIAKASGKTVRAIHHYEEVGLLRPHARSKGRYRLYDQDAVARVRWIGKLHDLGLSLSQIQAIVRAFEEAESAPGAMARIRSVYAQKLEETRAQIAHLASLERELSASVAYLETCDACDPAEIVAACSACSHHDPDEAEPDLVAGVRGKGARSPSSRPSEREAEAS